MKIIRGKWRTFVWITAVIAVLAWTGSGPKRGEAAEDHSGDGHGAPMGDHAKGKMKKVVKKGGEGPIIITMEELHNSGGTPPGWRFRIPKGDAADGRDAFVKMECFACHNIDGEKFSKKDKDPAKVGPDLSGMGAMHGDGAYFFESIVNPNRVILKGPGYIKDGLSIMPNYSDSITLQEAVDLVAYLQSLKGGHKMGGMKMKGMKGHKKMMRKRSGNPCAMKGMKKH
ncbi:MAG TPA: hypothetical protein DDZ83_15640 [Nitrospinae bacterium]|nr:hypothetical protein [Nitrospinota bacterium]